MPAGPGNEPHEAVARLWTVEEADERIATLGELLGQLKGWAERLHSVHEELARLAQFWGPELAASDHTDHELAARLGRERTHLEARLQEGVGALHAEGIEVKDLAHGLVDFYGLEGGELVFLCWKLGEPEVGYFHSLTGGFAGRRPLPSRLRSTDPSG